MIASLLMATSAAIILLLGCVHLVYTFRGNKLHPREPSLLTEMERVAPVISRETTMWKAWIGFNASHSLGAILFGLLYGYLAMAAGSFLFESTFILAVGLAMLASLLVLAKRYWFSIPLYGIGFALLLYVAGIVASRL